MTGKGCTIHRGGFTTDHGSAARHQGARRGEGPRGAVREGGRTAAGPLACGAGVRQRRCRGRRRRGKRRRRLSSCPGRVPRVSGGGRPARSRRPSPSRRRPASQPFRPDAAGSKRPRNRPSHRMWPGCCPLLTGHNTAARSHDAGRSKSADVSSLRRIRPRAASTRSPADRTWLAWHPEQRSPAGAGHGAVRVSRRSAGRARTPLTCASYAGPRARPVRPQTRPRHSSSSVMASAVPGRPSCPL